jgi:hypothetical protein
MPPVPEKTNGIPAFAGMTEEKRKHFNLADNVLMTRENIAIIKPNSSFSL